MFIECLWLLPFAGILANRGCKEMEPVFFAFRLVRRLKRVDSFYQLLSRYDWSQSEPEAPTKPR